MEQNSTEFNTIVQNKQQLPNASATLVLGIIAIVFSCCYFSPIGLTLGIIALAISGKSVKMYKENPELYEGYGNIKAGRVCAIIGLSLACLFLIWVVVYFAIVGTLISTAGLTEFWDAF